MQESRPAADDELGDHDDGNGLRVGGRAADRPEQRLAEVSKRRLLDPEREVELPLLPVASEAVGLLGAEGEEEGAGLVLRSS